MRVALVAALLATLLSACGGRQGLHCEDKARYASATSAQPVRIPDDLTPPNESDALRLPPAVGEQKPPSEPCLESPPNFFSDGGPRRLRRDAEQPAEEAPAEAPESEPEPDGERVIEN